MKNIEITNINEVKEFIKKHEDPEFGGFVSKFNQDKLLLIGWNDEIEIKLDFNFIALDFMDFINLIYIPLRVELPKYSTRKNFWKIVD